MQSHFNKRKDVHLGNITRHQWYTWQQVGTCGFPEGLSGTFFLIIKLSRKGPWWFSAEILRPPQTLWGCFSIKFLKLPKSHRKEEYLKQTKLGWEREQSGETWDATWLGKLGTEMEEVSPFRQRREKKGDARKAVWVGPAPTKTEN